MSVSVQIVDGEVGPAGAGHVVRAGAALVFEGIVRGVEEGRAIAALEYEAYEPMARLELEKLAAEMVARHGLLGIDVVHSRGRVEVGACSMRVTVWSAHRKEGLRAMDEFIDRLKRDVPIWKRAV